MILATSVVRRVKTDVSQLPAQRHLKDLHASASWILDPELLLDPGDRHPRVGDVLERHAVEDLKVQPQQRCEVPNATAGEEVPKRVDRRAPVEHGLERGRIGRRGRRRGRPHVREAGQADLPRRTGLVRRPLHDLVSVPALASIENAEGPTRVTRASYVTTTSTNP